MTASSMTPRATRAEPTVTAWPPRRPVRARERGARVARGDRDGPPSSGVLAAHAPRHAVGGGDGRAHPGRHHRRDRLCRRRADPAPGPPSERGDRRPAGPRPRRTSRSAAIHPHLATTGLAVDDRAPDGGRRVPRPPPRRGRPASSRTSSRAGTAIIDLGPDFRLRDPADYPRWYGFEHPRPRPARRRPSTACPSSTATSSRRSSTQPVAIVGSPGCYPTATILALAPLARAGLIGDLVVDAKSGVSGAGREAKADLMFGEVNESVKAYGLGGHRHVAEIEQELPRGRAPRGPRPGGEPGRDRASTSCPTSSR